jgi:SAM-dependent methyltransferase
VSQYDAFALDYAAHAASSPYNVDYERPLMLAQLGDVSRKAVLDAGCASGELTAALLERGAQVTALDGSGELLRIVRERFDERVVTVQADLDDGLAAFADASLDAIVSSLTIHYVRDLHQLFAEFRRVLKAEGELLFSTHHPANTALMVDDYFATKYVTDCWKIQGRQVNVQFYHRSMQSLIDPLLQNGFQIVRILEPPCALQPGRPWFLIIKARINF